MLAAERCALITGATGAIGPVLVRRLLDQGYQVRVLARHEAGPGLWPSTVQEYHGDVTDRRLVSEAAKGTDAVFHLAARLHLAAANPVAREEYQRVNVDGTRVVTEAARTVGVRRLVFFSTMSVYGPTGMDPVDEGTSPRPSTVYAETKLRAEEIALAARNLHGEGLAVVLRMAAVYGPRMKGNYVSLVNALAKGRFLPVGNGSNLRTLVYDGDAVRAAILAAEHPSAAGRVYNVSDGAVHSVGEIMLAICRALGQQPPRFYVPVVVARLAATVADGATALAGQPPRWLPAVNKFVENVAVRASRIQQELGFQPEYDLDRGWRETAAILYRQGAAAP